MPFNGSGGFTPLSAPYFPAVADTTILADQLNLNLQDIHSALENCVTRDGQSPATDNLPMGGNKHTGAANASAAGQYLVYGQSLFAADGTAAAPGIAFTSDPNTGLYLSEADTLTIATGGVLAFTVGSAGETLFRNYSQWTISTHQSQLSADASGWFFHVAGTDHFRVYTNAVERIRVLGTGGLQINAPTSDQALLATGLTNNVVARLTSANTSAQQKPDLYITRASAAANTVQSGANIVLEDVAAGKSATIQAAAGGLELWNYNGSAWHQTMKLHQDGHVSIGSTNNAGAFYVQAEGIGATTTYGTFNAANGYAYMALLQASTVYGYLGQASGLIGSGAATDFALRAEQNLILAANGVRRATILSTGHMIVNGTASDGTLRVVALTGSTPGTFDTTDATGGYVGFKVQNVAIGYVGQGSGIISGAAANDYAVRAENGLWFGTGGANARVGIASDGRLFGKALHNVGDVSGTTNQYIASGTYTPAVIAGSNVTTTTAYESRWIRVGNVVHVTGRMDLTVTTANIATGAAITLPIASNLTSAIDVEGVGVFQSGSGHGSVEADHPNDRAVFSSLQGTNGTAVKTVCYTFTYTVK